MVGIVGTVNIEIVTTVLSAVAVLIGVWRMLAKTEDRVWARINRVVVAVALALVALLSTPASAQIQDDLGGRRAAVCAADVLDYLTESQPPYTPIFHVGLATWFMGCTYYLPPAVGPILSTMRADIETIFQHRGEEEDVSGSHRKVVCLSWWAIYSSTYNGLIPRVRERYCE